MDFLPEEIEGYSERFTQKENPLLKELNRFTHANVLMPRMLAGHLQGRVLSMMSHMIKPEKVIEVGTYTGYSALCWAEGLAEGGRVHTIEVNDELESNIRRFLSQSDNASKVTLHLGPALDVLPTIEGPYDVVYLDADKVNYCAYFDAVIEKTRVGGYVIADNVLWSGKVTANENEMDAETKALHDYNKKVHDDPRLENVLIPIRDGLMIARKIS